MHQWSYVKSSLAGEKQIGPISEAELLDAIKQGQVKPKTKVHCQTRTSGKWLYASQVPVINEVFSEVERRAEKEKMANKKLRDEQREEKKRMKEVQKTAEEAEQRAQKKALAEEQRNAAQHRTELLSMPSVQGEKLVEIRNLLARIDNTLTKINSTLTVIGVIIVLFAIVWCIGGFIMSGL